MRAIIDGTVTCPIINMFDIDGEVTDDIEWADCMTVLLPDNSTRVVWPPRRLIVETKVN
jgi:hypothetical protein